MKRFKIYIAILLLSLTTGCAAMAVSALSGVGYAVHYTATNVACKTFSFTLDRADKATMFALRKMNIKVIGDSPTKKGKRIKAATEELDITIDLEQITSKATKISVNAKKGPMLKDKATAGEIVAQVGRILEGKS